MGLLTLYWPEILFTIFTPPPLVNQLQPSLLWLSDQNIYFGHEFDFRVANDILSLVRAINYQIIFDLPIYRVSPCNTHMLSLCIRRCVQSKYFFFEDEWKFNS